MPQRTLNNLIRTMFDPEPSSSVEVVKTASAKEETEAVPDEIEKLASVLDFIGRRGVENLLAKEASAKCSACGKACPPGSKSCPGCGASMSKTAGAPENNGGSQPGGKGSVDTSKTQLGDHHPALKSNEAAIDYDKREHAKEVSPALEIALKATPFADPTLKKNLTGAAGKGDKNIHSKTAGHDIEVVRAELARRVAASQSAAGGA